MRQKTEMSEAILTSSTAQKMIDYVSPIYGDSYVALWLYQAMGAVLDEIGGMATALRTESNPGTSSYLLDYWENHYGMSKDTSLTDDQRRARLNAKLQSRGPCNPYRLAQAVSAAIGGIEVRIIENIAQNTFRVVLQEYIPSLQPVVEVLERKKPAHLVYEIVVCHQTVSEAEIKAAVALVRAESFNVEVVQ